MPIPSFSGRPNARSVRLPLLGCLVAASAAGFATLAVAHEDDPKASEKVPAVFGPAWRAADGGVAAQSFAAQGVVLKAWFPVNTFDGQGQQNTSGNDCWGYVSPSGREYAIMGVSNGTGFVDVTVPEESQIVAFVPGPASLWRNVKVYQHYCYSVSEGGGGIQVMDLSAIDKGQVTVLPSVLTGGDARTHTMIINEETGFLYRMGGGPNGVRIYDLKPNPAEPLFVAQWNAKYTHDGLVVSYPKGPEGGAWAGREIFFACGGFNGGFVGTGVDILDVTDKSNIVVLSNFTYPQASFCHQAWITPDRAYLYINDEIDEQDFGLLNVGRIVNIENLEAPFLAGTYTTGLPSVDHNLYVRDNLLLCSNYKTGLQVFDLTDPTAPERIAFFDTFPDEDATGYAGLWSNYPFFPSGTVLGSDIQRGLFVWRIEPPVAEFSFPGGLPTFIDPRGGQTLDVAIAPRSGQTLDATSATLLVKLGPASAPGAPIEYPMTPLGGDLYRAVFPAFDCGDVFTYSFRIANDEGDGTTAPAGGVAATAALGEIVAFADDLESGGAGWVGGLPGDSATSGQWVLADPNGTTAQPEDARSPVTCWVTGNAAPGAPTGQADVDGGFTTLLSPVLDCSGVSDPYVSYWRWYSNNQGANPGSDTFPISISNDGGITWTTLEIVTENAGTWVQKSFRIADFVAPTATVRLRFVAQDLGGGSLVEAAIDDLTITALDCPTDIVGDVNGDGVVNATDLAVLLGQWGGPGSADLDGDGAVGPADLAILLGGWS